MSPARKCRYTETIMDIPFIRFWNNYENCAVRVQYVHIITFLNVMLPTYLPFFLEYMVHNYSLPKNCPQYHPNKRYKDSMSIVSNYKRQK